MITNRNLGVVTNNFHKFCRIIFFCRVIPEYKRRIKTSNKTKLNHGKIWIRKLYKDQEDIMQKRAPKGFLGGSIGLPLVLASLSLSGWPREGDYHHTLAIMQYTSLV